MPLYRAETDTQQFYIFHETLTMAVTLAADLTGTSEASEVEGLGANVYMLLATLTNMSSPVSGDDIHVASSNSAPVYVYIMNINDEQRCALSLNHYHAINAITANKTNADLTYGNWRFSPINRLYLPNTLISRMSADATSNLISIAPS